MEIDEYLKKYFNRHSDFLSIMGSDGMFPVMPSDDNEGGIVLKIDNEDFVGEARVVLNFLDLFDVSLYKYDYTNKPIVEVNNVHINNLIPTIEDLVRKQNKRLDEAKIANIITEELKKSDIIDIIKKDKDFENRVKDIVRDIVKDMYRILYQHNGIFTALGKS